MSQYHISSATCLVLGVYRDFDLAIASMAGVLQSACGQLEGARSCDHPPVQPRHSARLDCRRDAAGRGRRSLHVVRIERCDGNNVSRRAGPCVPGRALCVRSASARRPCPHGEQLNPPVPPSGGGQPASAAPYLSGYERIGQQLAPPDSVAHAVPANDRTRTRMCGRRVLIVKRNASMAPHVGCPECVSWLNSESAIAL